MASAFPARAMSFPCTLRSIQASGPASLTARTQTIRRFNRSLTSPADTVDLHRRHDFSHASSFVTGPTALLFHVQPERARWSSKLHRMTRPTYLRGEILPP